MHLYIHYIYTNAYIYYLEERQEEVFEELVECRQHPLGCVHAVEARDLDHPAVVRRVLKNKKGNAR